MMDTLKTYWWVLLIGFGIGGWAVASDIGQRTLEQQMKTVADATVVLQQRHLADDAKEELRKKYCKAGKLPEEECEDID